MMVMRNRCRRDGQSTTPGSTPPKGLNYSTAQMLSTQLLNSYPKHNYSTARPNPMEQAQWLVASAENQHLKTHSASLSQLFPLRHTTALNGAQM